MLKTASFAMSLIQVAVLIASLSIRGFAPLSMNSGFGPWSDTLDWMGAKNAYKMYNGDITNYFIRDAMGDIVGGTPPAERAFSGAQPWRLFTSIFLHSGIIHIVLNLVLQLRLALHAEVVWGMWRFLPIYFAAGINGALWSAVINPTQISVGASGALMGVVGAWFVFLLCHYSHGNANDIVRVCVCVCVCVAPRALWALLPCRPWSAAPPLTPPPPHTHTLARPTLPPRPQQVRRQQIIMTGINILLIMIMSAIPLIDWACHLFGLFSGLLLGMWYFGPALGGVAFAHDAPSLIAAQRAALANARAVSSGGALPAIPGAVVVGATASAASHWQGAGAGRSTGGSGSGSGSAKGSDAGAQCALAVDATTDCLCHPMTPINMACGPDAPAGLTRGALVSVAGLLGYFILLAVGFGLLYGGYLTFPPTFWGTLSGDQIYVLCFSFKTTTNPQNPAFQCPWPFDNLGKLGFK